MCWTRADYFIWPSSQFLSISFSSRLDKEVRQGYDIQVQRNAALLHPMLQSFTQQKAVDIAQQVEFYLKANPQMTVAALQKDEEFKQIALQQVSQTGFTALLGSSDGIHLFSPSTADTGHFYRIHSPDFS